MSINKTQRIILTIIIFVIIATLLVLIPYFCHANNSGVTPSAETYSHFLTTNAINSGSILKFQLFDYLLSQLLQVIPLSLLIWLFPLLFGLLSAFLFYLILRKISSQHSVVLLAVSLLALTPGFLAAYTGVLLISVIVFLVLLLLLVYEAKNYLFSPLLFLLFLFDPLTSLVVGVLLFIRELTIKRYFSAVLIFVVLSFGLLLFFFSPVINSLSSFYSFTFSINEVFSFLGGLYGISLFLLILGFGGIYFSSKLFKSFISKLLVTIFLLLALFYEPLRVLSLFLLAFSAANYLKRLYSQRWIIPSLRELTFILLLCILLFSTLTFVKEEIVSSPQQEQLATYLTIKNLYEQYPVLESSQILSNAAKPSVVAFFSQANLYGFDELSGRVNFDTNKLFASQDYTFLATLFSQENISLIIVDESELPGYMVGRPVQGLIFVMEHNNHFSKVFEGSNQVIYYFSEWQNKTFVP